MHKVMLALLALLTSTAHAYKFTCENILKFGRGELGTVPKWALPYCTGTAERAQEAIAPNYPNVLFMQSYEALVDDYGADAVAKDIETRMRKAGYRQLNAKTTNGVLVVNYANAAKKTAYAVFIMPKNIDHHLILVKTRLK